MPITIEYKDIENKLLLLFFINSMDFDMSHAQITDFVIEKDLMNHFVLEQNLTDLLERGFLKLSKKDSADENVTLYSLTELGVSHLELLEGQIPRSARNTITQYVTENRGKIKKYYEKTANYFVDAENDEFIVKCGVYDVYDDKRTMLMEISVPVVTREQVKQLQNNWNENYSSLYRKILEILTDSHA